MHPDRLASSSRGTWGRMRGLTLIELMVTVAIVAILASIAYPAYRSYVLKSNRTDAIRTLTEDAQILRRCYSQTFTFTGCTPIPPTAPASVLSPNGYYKVSSTITASPATFLLTAKATGPQAEDTTCAKFTLDQTGDQDATDSSGTDQASTCWGTF